MSTDTAKHRKKKTRVVKTCKTYRTGIQLQARWYCDLNLLKFRSNLLRLIFLYLLYLYCL